MKLAITALSASATLGLALAACGTATVAVPSSAATPAPTKSSPATAPSAAPSASVPQSAAPSSQPPSAAPSEAPAAPPSSVSVPNVTSPWAVVSAYYGDIESGDYSQAWALINDGAVTGQTYQQFVDGFACTGAQQLTEDGQSGNQVSFVLTAANTCTGQIQHFAGTDTVQGGKIVQASVHKSNT